VTSKYVEPPEMKLVHNAGILNIDCVNVMTTDIAPRHLRAIMDSLAEPVVIFMKIRWANVKIYLQKTVFSQKFNNYRCMGPRASKNGAYGHTTISHILHC